MNQVDKKICTALITQIITKLQPNDISKERKRDPSSKLDQNELKSLKAVISQLGWITGQATPDLAFETCMLSSNSENATFNEIIKTNKVLEKANRENVILRFDLKGNIKKICAEACYWIASLLNEIYNDNKKHPLPAIECNTVSRQLHEAILSIKPILDKRLRIDIALLPQMIEK